MSDCPQIKLLFSSHCKKYKILLPSDLYNIITKECIRRLPNETGGILIGKYRDNKIIITQITKPKKNAKLKLFTFERSPKGLSKLLIEHWNKFPREYYIGEWHFHPSESPKPSTKDLKQMKQILNDKNIDCAKPILLIVDKINSGNLRFNFYISSRTGDFISFTN